MSSSVPFRFPRILVCVFSFFALFLLGGEAYANSCGVLPFTPGRGVNDGAASNITSLISSEVDIRGGFGLVLTAGDDEVEKGCGKKSSCVFGFGKENGYERVVSGKVDNAGSGEYRVTATLWDVERGSEIREVEAVMQRSADVLVIAIPELVIELLTGREPISEEEEEKESPSFGDGAFAEDDDFGDDEPSSGEETRWMERDRRGRRIKNPSADDEDPLDFDDMDDLDDLDLDGLTEEDPKKKRKSDRKAKEAARRAEEERLAELAREEERRRKSERRRAEEERLRLDEERRREEALAREEAERAEQERRERQEREERRQAERERAREEERRRAASERRQREEAEERRQREEEALAAAEEDDYEDYELDDDEEVIEIKSALSFGSGIVIVEDDEGGDDYFGGDDESDGDYGLIIEDDEQEELQPGDIVEYDDEGQVRRARREEEAREEYSSRRRDDGRSFSEPDRDDRRERDREDEDLDLDLDLDLDGDEEEKDASFDFDRDSSRSSARATAPVRRSSDKGPIVGIRAGAGWAAYYPETLTLGMFNYGVEASFFPKDWISIDVGANFWSVSLIEYDEQGNEVRTVRTLPSFLFGATWHGNFHRVIKPYAGIDIGALLYAQAQVIEDGSTQIRPLFAPTVAADIGADFIIIPNFGLFVGGKFGVTYAARVQETVNSEWNPTTGLAEFWAGALVQF